jgi:hypothetical protein
VFRNRQCRVDEVGEVGGLRDGDSGARVAHSRHRTYFTSTTSLYRSDDGSLVETFGNSLVDVLPRHPAFSPDGAWIIAGPLVWNVQSGHPGQLLTLSPRYKKASVSTFLPDGTIAIAREDGVIELFCPQ